MPRLGDRSCQAGIQFPPEGARSVAGSRPATHVGDGTMDRTDQEAAFTSICVDWCRSLTEFDSATASTHRGKSEVTV